MSLGSFDLTGGPFLTLFSVLLVVTVIADVVVSRRRRPAGWGRGVDGVHQLAFLAGGAARVSDAVVTGMLAANRLRMTNKRQFVADGSGTVERPPVAWVLDLPQPIAWKDLDRTLRPYAVQVQNGLVRDGALANADETARIQRRTLLPYLLLFAFGGIKLIVGTVRDRPIGYLAGLLVVTGIIAVVRCFTVDRRTKAGTAALADARGRSVRLRRAATPDEIDRAVALFGTGVLAGSAWASYHLLRNSSGDGGDASTGGGGGCGGGGCGGCGS